jgi:hypothetical protein
VAVHFGLRTNFLLTTKTLALTIVEWCGEA